MKNKIVSIIMTVLTALMFIVMAYFRDWFGMLCMGGAFVCSLMSIKYHRE
jgi:hypothetical protein